MKLKPPNNPAGLPGLYILPDFERLKLAYENGSLNICPGMMSNT